MPVRCRVAFNIVRIKCNSKSVELMGSFAMYSIGYLTKSIVNLNHNQDSSVDCIEPIIFGQFQLHICIV